MTEFEFACSVCIKDNVLQLITLKIIKFLIL